MYGEEATAGAGEGSLLRRFLSRCMEGYSYVRRHKSAHGTSKMVVVFYPGEELDVGGRGASLG